MPITGVRLTVTGERVINELAKGVEFETRSGFSFRRQMMLAVLVPDEWSTVDTILQLVNRHIDDTPLCRDDVLSGVTFLSAQSPPLVELAHKVLSDLHNQVLSITTKAGGGIKLRDLIQALTKPSMVMPRDLEEQILTIVEQSPTLRILNYNSGSRKFIYFV